MRSLLIIHYFAYRFHIWLQSSGYRHITTYTLYRLHRTAGFRGRLGRLLGLGLCVGPHVCLHATPDSSDGSYHEQSTVQNSG